MFAEHVIVKVRFMPFQLYPHLPSGESNEGVVKDDIFKELIGQRYPEATEEMRLARTKPLAAAWAAEGLCLRSPPTGLNADGGGRMGSSFDSQRLILLARSQGLEDEMIEEVYTANHARDECLSDWKVLLNCAKRAGVREAEAKLNSGWGVNETIAKIEEYKAMGVTAVPVVVLDSVGKTPIKSVLSSGAPEQDFLNACIAHVVQTGTLPWKAGQQPLPMPQPTGNWQPHMAAGATTRTVAKLADPAAFVQAHSQANASGRLLVVDFSASWCGPCKAIGPQFAEMATEFPHVDFASVDVDENQQVAQACRIRAMPTFQFFRNGKQVGEMSGADANQLRALLKQYGGPAPSAAAPPSPAPEPGKPTSEPSLKSAPGMGAGQKVEKRAERPAGGGAMSRIAEMLGGGGAAIQAAEPTKAGGCEGGRCVPSLGGRLASDENDGAVGNTTVVNVLRGSLHKSASRPHAMVIDADFVTCTQ